MALLDKKQSELTPKEKEIVSLMFEYDLDEIQAEEMYSTEQKQKADALKPVSAEKPKRHYVKSDKPREKSAREPDAEKREIMALLFKTISAYNKNATLANEERQIDFGNYTLTLTKHRTKKA